jgi:hypothetical protein
MRSNYEEKRANRLERYERLASKFSQESDIRYQRFKSLLSVIPMGQPILVGHHSEKGHRSLLKKADNNMRKSVEADDKSKYYADRAETVENNHAISSDDPNALERLQEKLAGLEKNQELMKKCNKITGSKKLTEAAKIEQLIGLGLKESTAMEIMTPRYGRVGIPSFKLTNNNATIRTVKQRIERLQKIEAMPDEEKAYGDITVKALASENRVQMFFPGKPSDEIRTELKRSGFRWSPMNGCWQAFYSNRSKHNAIDIIRKHQGI